MIVNLFGPIAVGKSRFADWYTQRNPDCSHFTIDNCRKAAIIGCDKDTKAIDIEDMAWEIADKQVGSVADCIWESTGVLWRSVNLWTPERVVHGIYSIKFEANRETCQARSIERAKPKLPPPYDGDELEDIEYTSHAIARAPANLIVDLTSLDNIDKVYRQIEWQIIKAKAVFEAKEVGATKITG